MAKFKVIGREQQLLNEVEASDAGEALNKAIKLNGAAVHHVEEIPQSELAEAVEELKKEEKPMRGRFSV